jgi:hypothetical protein
MEALAKKLFGDIPMKWIDEYFPFTHPSWELEIFFNGKWMEVLGCGIIHRTIMKNCNIEHCTGYVQPRWRDHTSKETTSAREREREREGVASIIHY